MLLESLYHQIWMNQIIFSHVMKLVIFFPLYAVCLVVSLILTVCVGFMDNSGSLKRFRQTQTVETQIVNSVAFWRLKPNNIKFLLKLRLPNVYEEISTVRSFAEQGDFALHWTFSKSYYLPLPSN